MRLIALTPHFFGPFFGKTTLQIERDVTVLTGANDTGKSSVLRMLSTALENLELKESEVNEDRQGQPGTNWHNDPEVGATLVVEVTDPGRDLQAPDAGRFQRGDRLTLRYRFGPSARSNNAGCKVESTDRNGSLIGSCELPKLVARLLSLPPLGALNEIIDIAKPGPLEHKVLSLAFDTKHFARELDGLGDRHLSKKLRTAEERLTTRFREVLPASNPLSVVLNPVKGKDGHLALELHDSFEARTPFGVRGAGVRRLLSVFAELGTANLDQGDTVIVFDEPETALHADSQHVLRNMLENLAEKDTVQVIYSTHSPSMLNTMRPRTIRLLRREKLPAEIATSVVENRTCDESFLGIRMSLGVSPADSLLYAPVTIVFEGASDIEAVTALLQRLHEEHVEGFEAVAQLVGQCSPIDGNRSGPWLSAPQQDANPGACRRR